VWHAYLEVSLRPDVCQQRSAGAGAAAPLAADAVAALLRDRDAQVMSNILRNPDARYDPAHALVLCHAMGCRAGVIYLYERLGMHSLALSALGDSAEAARAAGRHTESRAMRRDMVRRAKALTGSGGLAGTDTSAAAAASAAAAVGGVGGKGGGAGAGAAPAPVAVSASASVSAAAAAAGAGGSAPAAATGGSEVEASTLWLNLFRFMAASYVDERGATACLPRDGSAAAAAAAEAEAAAPAHI
jgi:hypothetical protein